MFAGNVGNVFSIDPEIGTIHVARELDYSVMSEYTLVVKAVDSGSPPLSSTIHVHIMVTMADNAPPRYVNIKMLLFIIFRSRLGSLKQCDLCSFYGKEVQLHIYIPVAIPLPLNAPYFFPDYMC